MKQQNQPKKVNKKLGKGSKIQKTKTLISI
jgi:hypothetical protein